MNIDSHHRDGLCQKINIGNLIALNVNMFDWESTSLCYWTLMAVGVVVKCVYLWDYVRKIGNMYIKDFSLLHDLHKIRNVSRIWKNLILTRFFLIFTF